MEPTRPLSSGGEALIGGGKEADELPLSRIHMHARARGEGIYIHLSPPPSTLIYEKGKGEENDGLLSSVLLAQRR